MLTSTSKNAIIQSLITDCHLKQTIQFKVVILMEGDQAVNEKMNVIVP